MGKTTRRCTVCREVKPLDADNFYRLKTDKQGFDRRCKLCDNKRTDNRKRNHYNAFKNQPCVDCGNQYHPCAMDFDHLPGTEKKWDVSQLKGRARKELAIEMAKCEVVCAVCHRIRTYIRATHPELLGNDE